MASAHDQRVPARARARAEALIRASQRTTTTIVLACVIGSIAQLGFAVLFHVANHYGWNGITGVAGVMVPIVVAIIAVGMSGGWWLVVPLGLIERIIALCDIAALMLLAVLCRQELRAPGRVLK
jgi:hypothetical protein